MNHTTLSPSALRARRWLIAAQQLAIVLAVLAALAWCLWMIRTALARNGVVFDMGFLTQPAGFSISEGWIWTWQGLRSFASSDNNAQALLVGLGNTLKVAVLAIVLSTVVGTLLGIARLSHNWLLRQLSFLLIEFVRSTPLLIQLVFWYFAVVLQLPALHDAAHGFGAILASQQGIFLPGLSVAAQASSASIALFVVALLLSAATLAWRRHLLLGSALLSWLATCWLGFPLRLVAPQIDGFIVNAAMTISPEFAAILLGLSVYTAAFIAEIVRGAMLALPKGQWEACAALGMRRAQTLRDVVVPQVWRIVLPAFGNQYINIAKNTSLGIAIGYSDLFNVYGTVSNQSGRSLEGVLVAMLAYLLMSWLISATVNWLNHCGQYAGGQG